MSEEHYVACDFEFKQIRKGIRDIGLFQMNIENDNYSYIFVFNPNNMTKKEIQILIDLLTMNDIIKILHGGHSLDVPYLYSQILVSKENINRFSMNLYDTEFLCEYDNIIGNKKKCGIYELLLNENIITNEKKDELEKNEPDVRKAIWDIKKLDEKEFKYSVYDVVFLPQLVRKYIIRSDIHKLLIPQITGLVYSYRRDKENTFNELERLINIIDNNYIKEDDENITLSSFFDLFNNIIYYKDLENIREINYFKRFMTIMAKLIFYFELGNYNNIIRANDGKEFYNQGLSKYFRWINKYRHINELLMKYQKNVIKQFKIMYKKK